MVKSSLYSKVRRVTYKSRKLRQFRYTFNRILVSQNKRYNHKPEFRSVLKYEGCPESIQPVWISREPVSWPWSNLSASQRRRYGVSVNSHSPVGASQSAVRRRWLSLCTVRTSHSQWPSEQISESASMRLANSTAIVQAFSGKVSHHPGLSAPLQPRFGSLRLLAFTRVTIAVGREEICECDSHTVHKLSQRRLTADWLAPQDSDCSRLRSKVSSDWLPSYIKATRTSSRDIQNGWKYSGQPLYYMWHTLWACRLSRRLAVSVWRSPNNSKQQRRAQDGHSCRRKGSVLGNVPT